MLQMMIHNLYIGSGENVYDAVNLLACTFITKNPYQKTKHPYLHVDTASLFPHAALFLMICRFFQIVVSSAINMH